LKLTKWPTARAITCLLSLLGVFALGVEVHARNLEVRPRSLSNVPYELSTYERSSLEETLDAIQSELFKKTNGSSFPAELQADLSNILITHPTWRKGKAAILEALAQIGRVEAGSQLQLTANVDLSSRAASENPVSSSPAFRSESLGSQIRARKLLIDFGSTKTRVAAAKNGLRESQLDVSQDQSELLLTISSGILGRQQLLLQSLWQSVLLSERQLVVQMAKQRLTLGAGTIYELARAQSALSEAALERDRSNDALLNLENALNRVGVKKSTFFNLEIEVPLPEIEDSPNQFRTERLPEVLAIDQRVERLRLELEATQKDRLPRLYFDAQTSIRQDASQGSRPFIDGSLQLNFEYSLLDGGSNRSSSAALSAQLQEALAEKEATVISVSDELGSIKNQLSAIEKSLPVLRKALGYEITSYQAARERFLVRRGTIEQIQQAEEQLKARVLELINAAFDQLRLRLQLNHKAGTLFEVVLPIASPRGL